MQCLLTAMEEIKWSTVVESCIGLNFLMVCNVFGATFYSPKIPMLKSSSQI